MKILCYFKGITRRYNKNARYNRDIDDEDDENEDEIDNDTNKIDIKVVANEHFHHHHHHHDDSKQDLSLLSLKHPLPPPQELQIQKRLSQSGQSDVQEKSLTSSPLAVTSGALAMAATATTNEITDARIIKILNEFVFYLFLLFCILLNLLGLVVFPYCIKQPLSVDDSAIN